MILPRPDLNLLGINYRRIPVMAIGRDIYHDTRLIINKLNALYPSSAEHPGLTSTDSEQLATQQLLSVWINDGGIFNRCAQLIPPSAPMLKDPKFTKDRAQMSGRSWSAAALAAARPEALVELRNAFAFLENTLLKDGRKYLTKSDGPTQVDLEAVWALQWLFTLPGSLPEDVVSEKLFPKTYALINRFMDVVDAARKKNGKIQKVKGDEAAEKIYASAYAEEPVKALDNDPSGLKKGTEVLVHPTDSGVQNKDKGTLISMDWEEIVIEVQGQSGKMCRVHAPRHGFRVVPNVEEARI